jgi:hypothetical protein
MRIPVSIRASYNMANIKALVDSGATDNFIHPNFVKWMGLGQRELDKPKNIYNIDDTTNKSGQITHYLSLAITTAGKMQEMRFLITNIGREDVLLGYPWLSTYEPRFSWKHGTIDESNLPIILRTINPHERRDVVARYLSTDEWADIVAELERDVGGEPSIIRNTSVDLAVAAQQYTKQVEIPKEYRKFAKVFSEGESKRFPPRRSCDHAIKFKPGAPDAIECKIYPMTRSEDEALDVFIDKQLEKGYIRPSKLVFTSSVARTEKNCNWTGVGLQKTETAVAVLGIQENNQLQFFTFCFFCELQKTGLDRFELVATDNLIGIVCT